jgi:Esterase/lipase
VGITFKSQILNYHFLDCHTDPLKKGKGSLECPIMYVFNELYSKHEERRLPTVSPIYAYKKLLKGITKAIVITAENDNLRAEGEVYI